MASRENTGADSFKSRIKVPGLFSDREGVARQVASHHQALAGKTASHPNKWLARGKDAAQIKAPQGATHGKSYGN